MNKLPQKILCFVTPYLPKQEKYIPFIEFTKYAIDGGVNMIQIRDKNTSINLLENFAEKIYQFAGNEICIMINSKFPSVLFSNQWISSGSIKAASSALISCFESGVKMNPSPSRITKTWWLPI